MMFTAPRGTHRAPGRAVTDLSGLVGPVGRGLGSVAVLGAVAAGSAFLSNDQARAEGPTPMRGQIALPSVAQAAKPAAMKPAQSFNYVKLRHGARGEAVSALQQQLVDRGARIAVDGVFGRDTLNAVRDFQRSQGLQVDGIVGPLTWSALGSVATPQQPSTSTPQERRPLLRHGARGDSVRALQSELNNHRADIAVDGIFGRSTLNSVRTFQANAGIGVDGVVGRDTWNALHNSNAAAKPVSGSPGASRPTPSTPGFNGRAIVNLAKDQQGAPYVWGGSSPSGFDCSGLTSWTYRQMGIDIPRTARQQVYGGRIISRSEAVPGDLVAFTGGNYGHIGIYAGNGKIIDASGSRGEVMYRSIWDASHVFVTYR
ncbi:C40 family peptidase [Devriesea agamarum]|uniref:C40 family peptidase n=1 Tax=Devriesea agamarum TaxID=472569 RepID=UPI00071C755D|nr:peptidoglycan-binding protein [Devriesea agamarum]